MLGGMAGLMFFFPFGAGVQTAFQPYNTQGDNLIHVATADFDEVGGIWAIGFQCM